MNIKDLAPPYPKLASELRQQEKLLELYQKKSEGSEGSSSASKP